MNVRSILASLRGSTSGNKAVRPGGAKIFCVGRNKTGTTSLQKAFELLGYPVGDQRQAEVLFDRHYFERRFDPIVKYCRTAQVFQDVPFSCPYLFVTLDQRFPGSRFILSVRNDPEQWYSSLIRFHAKLWGTDGQPPTAAELKRAPYLYEGFSYKMLEFYGTTDSDPYHKETLIQHYLDHNRTVIDYFKHRPQDLLVVNLAEKGAYQRFIDFLGITSPFTDFPRENVT